jgi:hypothetical protein
MVLLAGSILFFGLFLLHRLPLVRQDTVATAILADMVLTFPVAFYFLLIRPFGLKKWRLLLVFSCCCAAAYLILPAHQQQYVLQLRKLSAVVEIGGLIYILNKFKRIRAVYLQLQSNFPDPAYHIYQSLSTVLGNSFAVNVLATELGILRFGLFCWKRQPLNNKVICNYTTYKRSGYAALFGVLLFVCLVEASAVHLMLVRYSLVAAWIFTGLSIYGVLFIIGDFSAIIKSPVLILKEQLVLRAGMRWRAVVNFNNIDCIEELNSYAITHIDGFDGSLMKGNANVLLTFKQPVNIDRLYRKPVMMNRLAINIDASNEFITELRKLIAC